MQNLSCWVQQRGMRRPGRPGGAPPSARTCCGVAGLSNLFKTWDIFAFGLGTFSSVNQTREKIFASWTLCHSLVSLLATWYRIGTIPFSTVACLVPPPLLVPTWWESSSMKLSHPISVLLYFFSPFLAICSPLFTQDASLSPRFVFSRRVFFLFLFVCKQRGWKPSVN